MNEKQAGDIWSKAQDIFYDAVDLAEDGIDRLSDFGKVVAVRTKEFINSPKMEKISHSVQKGIVSGGESFVKAIRDFIKS